MKAVGSYYLKEQDILPDVCPQLRQCLDTFNNQQQHTTMDNILWLIKIN